MRVIGFILLAGAAYAADSKDNLTQAQADDIIQKFAAKESAFARARENYTYRQTARVLDLNESGATVGKWEEVTDIIFTADGKRTEHVVRAPVTTLQNFAMDPEDMQDMRSVQPFVLTTEEVPNYLVR